jgi:DNA-binding NarL/FixJ family response regulator
MMCVAVQETPGPRILIVEDSQPLRGALREWLAASLPQSRLFEAASGEEAVSVAGEVVPDIILMDIGLPGIDGLQATQAIRARWPGTRVVILTIHEDHEYRARSEAVGASAFVPKRTMRSELLPVLRRLVAALRGETPGPCADR